MANVHSINTKNAEQQTASDRGREVIGSYAIENDAIISIPMGSALDYAQMRASQLLALNAMMAVETFEHFSNEIKQHAHWLASTLSDEVCALMEIVAVDAQLGMRAPSM